MVTLVPLQHFRLSSRCENTVILTGCDAPALPILLCMVKGRGKTARASASSGTSPRVAALAKPGSSCASPIVSGGGSVALLTDDPFWSGAQWSWVSHSLDDAPLDTRAEFEAERQRYPPGMLVVDRMVELAVASGLCNARSAAFLLSYKLPEDHDGWIASGGGERFGLPARGTLPKLGDLSLSYGDLMMGLVRAVHARGGSVSPHHWINTAIEVRRKFDADAGVAWVKDMRHSSGGVHDLRAFSTVLRVAGWDGRAVSLERASVCDKVSLAAAKGRVKRLRKVHGISVEELKRLAAYKNGRRYLWPDERDGSYYAANKTPITDGKRLIKW